MSTIVSYTSEIKDIDITQILSIFKPIFTFTQITQTIKKKINQNHRLINSYLPQAYKHRLINYHVNTSPSSYLRLGVTADVTVEVKLFPGIQGHVGVVEELGELRRHEDLQREQQLRHARVVLGHAAVHT